MELVRLPPRPRSDERGAALLIVVLVVMLLSGVGLFALRSASRIDSATGFNRQLVQTSFMGEFAARTAAAAITAAPDSVIDQLDAQSAPGGPTPPTCKGTGGAWPCIVYDTAYIYAHLSDTAKGLVGDEWELPGMLGTERPISAGDTTPGASRNTRADFHVEIYSLAPSGYWTAGAPIDDNSLRVSIQAEARLRPLLGTEYASDASTTCSAQSASATSVRTLRATIRFVKEGT